MELSPALARIVAHICADGYLVKCTKKRSPKELAKHPRKKKVRGWWVVCYTNTSAELVDQYINDVRKVFGRKAVYKSKHTYEIAGKRVYEIVKFYGAGKSDEWRISEEILNASEEIKIEWLKAFFDDEAYVERSKKRIILNCVNRNGLIQISSILSDLDIESILYGPYYYKKYKIFRLTIPPRSVRRYAEKIGFVHGKKQNDLEKIAN